MKLMIFTIALFFTAMASAQDSPYIAIKFSWEPNPPSENVAWYEIETSYKGEYSLLESTNNNDYTISVVDFVSRLPDAPANDAEFCVRIIAARGNDRSQPSEPACFTLQRIGEPPNETASALSTPKKLVVEFR
jgi:subtilase family serine protease